MLLSTLTCSHEGCTNQIGATDSMWAVIWEARRAGWTIDEANDRAWCPGHGPAALPSEIWAVGCYTCSWEDEEIEDPITSEKEAKRIASEHECEPDTWIMSPAKLAAKEARRKEYELDRATRRAHEEEQARVVTETALARQQEIERWAKNWLTIRNKVVFWRRITWKE